MKAKNKFIFIIVILIVAIFKVNENQTNTLNASFYTENEPLFSEDFEDNNRFTSFFNPQYDDVYYEITNTYSEKINGVYSAVSPKNIDGYKIILSTDPSKIILGANKTYSVVFKAKVIEKFDGGNFYIEVGDDSNLNFRYWRFDDKGNELECGAKGADDGTFKDWYLYNKTSSFIDYIDDYFLIKFTFITSSDNYRIKIGVNANNQKGRIAVDDIKLYEGSKIQRQQIAIKKEDGDEGKIKYTETISTNKYTNLDSITSKLRNNDNEEEAIRLIKEAGYAPNYHYYSLSGGRMGDANGFFYYKGYYHLFYQFFEDINGNSVALWKHAASKDLISWFELGTPLKNDMPYDKDGVWSGQAFFDKNNNPVVTYYGNKNGVCLARPKDLADPLLKEWVKDENNPVIPIHNANDKYIVYDPSNVFIIDDTYYLLTGNKTYDTNLPTAYLFKSKDLIKWDYVHEFITKDDSLFDYDDMACPNIAYMKNGIYLLISSSHRSGVFWYTGTIENLKFKILKSGRFNNYGGNEMASSLMQDENGKTIYISWLTETRRDASLLASGFSGVMTLPKELTVDDEGNLYIKPIATIKSLQTEDYSLNNVLVKNNIKKLEYNSLSYELNTSINLLDAVRVGFKIACSEKEETIIYYDRSDSKIHIDYSNSSLEKYPYNKYIFDFIMYEYQAFQTSKRIQLNDSKLNIRIFMDNNVLEIYVNDILSMSQRIYPSDKNSNNILLFTEGGTALFESIKIYNMKGAF